MNSNRSGNHVRDWSEIRWNVNANFRVFTTILPRCARATAVPKNIYYRLWVEKALGYLFRSSIGSKPIEVLSFRHQLPQIYHQKCTCGHSLLFAIGGSSCPSCVSHVYLKKGGVSHMPKGSLTEQSQIPNIPKTNLQGAISYLGVEKYKQFTKHHRTSLHS